MDEVGPLTGFLSWLIASPERIETYQTPEGLSDLVGQWEAESGLTLPEDYQSMLRTNNLRGAIEVVKQETGSDNVLFFVIRFVI
jgi:hypothetical protein